MADSIVACRLSKQYHPPKGPVALREVTLRVREGEILSLLGPNGAGKTTFIAVLCGLLSPTGGEVSVHGLKLADHPLAVKQLIGVVPEEIALYPQLSGRRNLRYFGRLYGLSSRAVDEAASRVLDLVGLADRADDKVSHYSSGMKRRLNIAVGMIHAPRIMLMDEPTLGLDPEGRRRILDLVLLLQRDLGTTILYTTHHMGEAQEISDRVAIIHRGEIIAVGDPSDLIREVDQEALVRLRVGPSSVSTRALDQLVRIQGVGKVLVHDDRIELSTVCPGQVLPEVLSTLERACVEIDTLIVQQPNLETVFLRLTGESLTSASDDQPARVPFNPPLRGGAVG